MTTYLVVHIDCSNPKDWWDNLACEVFKSTDSQSHAALAAKTRPKFIFGV